MITHACELVRFASDAALAIDVNARIVAWNVAAHQLLGHHSSEVIGEHCGDVLQACLPDGKLLCRSDCDVLKCFGECRPNGVSNCLLRHRNGELISTSIASIPMSNRARRLYGDQVVSVFIIRDAAIVSPVSKPQRLQVFTLGGFRVSINGEDVDTGNWRRKQSLNLLKYLLTQADRPVYRERLLDFLWPDADEKQARGRLKVTVYDLRRELRINGLEDAVLTTAGNAYRLNRDLVWVDADAFEQLATEAHVLQDRKQWHVAIDRYEQARNLYRGDYLEEEVYAGWCRGERERLRELYLEVLTRNAECYAHSEKFAEAVNICRKALVLDPCLENFHFMLMKYLASAGHPELASTQYNHCRELLAREFDTTPLPRTRRLYKSILNQT